MKKLILPLILILLLTFTLIGDCWVAGYDQRIKLTIDHTKIDDTLTNFPVTVFFTGAQAEEIFSEFNADEDFDRGQFALGDNTLLKAEKELFSLCTSQYPPAQSDTYVKATTKASTLYWAYYATNPLEPLTGPATGNTWLSADGATTNQRFHIDLGSAKIITRIYYENRHHYGGATSTGVQNFTFWGSNTGAGTFDDLVYANDEGWTQLTTSQSTFDRHVGLDQADPKYITVTNSTAYRYYAFKFADNYGSTEAMGVRRIELQIQEPKAIYHVKIPSISPSVDTDYYFYYDNDADHNTSYIGVIGSATAAEVWDSNTKAMYQLGDGLDSTSNSKDLTKTGTVNYVTGKIHNAASAAWDTDNNLYHTAILGNNLGTGNITMSCVFLKNGATAQLYDPRILAIGISADHAISLIASPTDGYAKFISFDGSYTNAESTTNICDNSYHYVVGVRNGTSMKIYVDGTEVGSGTDIIRNIDGDILSFGNSGNPTYDELGQATIDRTAIENTARSAAWIKATYNTLWDSLLTYGREERKEAGNALFWFNF